MQNIGPIDRLLRLIVGVALLAAGFVPSVANLLHIPVEGTWHWVAIVVGVIMVGTAAIRFCPLYRLIGLRT